MVLHDAHEMGLVLWRWVIGPARADIFGRMALDAFTGSVSDGIRSLTALSRYRDAPAPEPPRRPGGAVLETRSSTPRGHALAMPSKSAPVSPSPRAIPIR